MLWLLIAASIGAYAAPECEIGFERRGRQQVARQRSTGEPAEHDAGHDERGALDRLAIVELSETGEDPGENECNDLSRSGRLVHGITVGRWPPNQSDWRPAGQLPSLLNPTRTTNQSPPTRYTFPAC